MPGRDAPGHRPRHDLLPGVGITHREPAHHAVDGAACGRAAELQRRARALTPTCTSSWSRSTRDGWRGRCRRSTSTTSRTSGTAGPSRSSPSSRATTSAARCTRRSRTTRSRCTTSRSPAPTACSGATTTRTPRAPIPIRTRSSTGLLVDVGDDDAHAIVFDNAARLFGFSGARRRAGPVSASTSRRPRHRAEPSRHRGRAVDPQGAGAGRGAHHSADRRRPRPRRRAQEPRVHRAGGRRSHEALAARLLPTVREQGQRWWRRSSRSRSSAACWSCGERVDEADAPDRPAPRLRRRLLRAGDREPASGARRPVQAFTEFSVHLDFAAPAKAVGRVPAAADPRLRAAPRRHRRRVDPLRPRPRLLAAFLLSSVRTVTEIAIAGTSTARPDR